MTYQELRDRLAKLPLRAIVTVAARCARRVQPLARTLPEESQSVIDRAIAATEIVARGGPFFGIIGTAVASEAAIRAQSATAASAVEAADAAERASVAVGEWAIAESDVDLDERTDAALEGARAARASADAAAEAADVSSDVDAATAFAIAIRAAKADIDRLLALGLGEPGTLGSSIDPSESGPLGPLWPDGEPAWYANPPKPPEAAVGVVNAQLGPLGASAQGVATPPAAPPITFYFDAAEFSAAEMAEALALFSDLYRAIGGDALVIDRTEMLDPSLVLTPEEA